ncbi:archaellin/type IV pilin N-terminal domain-containing protein [Halorientalis litorea]|uniref:archaellin/type IV pilin N-terminal domain-containing protein n=1 Tax=Halorientalis litorea TaxID=2931977 RepID=UPI001FF23E21|nr:archaellin/type IV pilin N-terminal domain-containing protein [Halorientalis litorea]
MTEEAPEGILSPSDLGPDGTRGQVGIGTLIIFIALVLVAAVAAGVLINTGGQLESRASDTGDDAQAQVSNQVDVVSATGVDKSVHGSMERIELVLKKSAGSDDIDLEDMTIQYRSGSAAANLEHTTGTADGESFSTTHIAGTGGAASPTVLNETSERVEIRIDVVSVEGTSLEEGASAELTFVEQSGATTVYGVDVPNVIQSDYFPV